MNARHATMDHRAILIVEDNLDDTLLLEDALKAANVNCPLVFTQDGKEAEAYLFNVSESNDLLPGLIFLDLTLPSLSGMKLLQELRANPATRRIPVIILTGSHEQRDLINSYNAGANSYVMKGGHIEEFHEKIKCLCRYWLEVCSLPSY